MMILKKEYILCLAAFALSIVSLINGHSLRVANSKFHFETLFGSEDLVLDMSTASPSIVIKDNAVITNAPHRQSNNLAKSISKFRIPNLNTRQNKKHVSSKNTQMPLNLIHDTVEPTYKSRHRRSTYAFSELNDTTDANIIFESVTEATKEAIPLSDKSKATILHYEPNSAPATYSATLVLTSEHSTSLIVSKITTLDQLTLPTSTKSTVSNVIDEVVSSSIVPKITGQSINSHNDTKRVLLTNSKNNAITTPKISFITLSTSLLLIVRNILRC